jgi:hypothetical protein
MFIFIYGHIRVKLFLRTYTCTSLHTRTPICLYKFIYFYAYVYIFLRPYTETCLHTSTPVQLCTFTYVYIHMPIQIYLRLPSFNYTGLHTSTTIFALHMFTYFYAHIRPIDVYIILCSHSDTCLLPLTHVYRLLCT